MRSCQIAFAFGCALAAQDLSRSPAQILEEANAQYRALRPEDAVRLYREYLVIAPRRSDVRVYLGAALLNLNQLEAALEEARRAITLDAGSSKAYILAGRIYAAQEHWDIAQEFFAKALALDPSDRDGWYFSGRAFFEAGRFNESIHSMIRAGASSRAYESLGLAYQAIGNSEKARESLKRAVELANGSHRPYLAYGTFLFKEGRLAESLPMLQEAARLEPNSLDARFEFARALYQAGRFQEAASILALNGPATGGQCKVHLLRSRVLTRLAQTEAAQKELEVFHSCSNGHP